MYEGSVSRILKGVALLSPISFAIILPLVSLFVHV